MGNKTVPQPPYSPDLAPCDFWLFPKLKEKLRGCRYETIEGVKVAVMKIIDTLTQEDFYGAFQKLLERYNMCIATGGDYFEGDKSFMCVISTKVPIQKMSGNLFNDLRIYICITGFVSGLCVVSFKWTKNNGNVDNPFIFARCCTSDRISWVGDV